MAKVLFAWELGSGLGHCAKLAPLATDLMAGGHDVYFAARDVTTVRRVLPATNLRLLQAPCLLARPATIVRQTRTFPQIIHNVGFGDDEQLRSVVMSWRNLFDLVRPDIVICEHAPSALLASRWSNCRRIVVGTGFSLPPDVSPLPDLCSWAKPTTVNLADHEFTIRDRVNRLLTDDGLAPLERFAQLYGDAHERFLVTFPELDHHAHRGPAEYWGNWSLNGGGHLVSAARSEFPRIFAYLKPSAGPWKVESMLGLLRGLPFATTAYVPDGHPALQKLQSPTLRIVSERLDLAAQLRNCNLAIVNGTAGTCTQCLLAGVPLLMVPLVLEQIILSRRIVGLGAGLMAPPHRPEQFATKLWRLVHEDSYRQAAQAFAARYATYDARQRQREAVKRIDSYIAANALLQSSPEN